MPVFEKVRTTATEVAHTANICSALDVNGKPTIKQKPNNEAIAASLGFAKNPPIRYADDGAGFE